MLVESSISIIILISFLILFFYIKLTKQKTNMASILQSCTADSSWSSMSVASGGTITKTCPNNEIRTATCNNGVLTPTTDCPPPIGCTADSSWSSMSVASGGTVTKTCWNGEIKTASCNNGKLTLPTECSIRPASGWKDYCSNYCSTKIPSPGFEPYCKEKCTESNSWDASYHGPWDKSCTASSGWSPITVDPGKTTSKTCPNNEIRTATCNNGVLTPTAECPPPIGCTADSSWSSMSVASGGTVTKTCWNGEIKTASCYNGKLTVPSECSIRPASGWKDYCSSYCSTKIPSPGFEPYCKEKCTDSNCYDCAYKGPWDKSCTASSGWSPITVDPGKTTSKTCPNNEIRTATCNNGVLSYTTECPPPVGCTADSTWSSMSVASGGTVTKTCWNGELKTASCYNGKLTLPTECSIRPASGWKAYCSSYCSTKIPSPGFEPYCKEKCTDSNCYDCAYKGPWDKSCTASSGWSPITVYPGKTTSKTCPNNEIRTATCNNGVLTSTAECPPPVGCTADSSWSSTSVASGGTVTKTCWNGEIKTASCYNGKLTLPTECSIRPASGWKDYCSSYCSTNKPSPGFEPYCPIYCTSTYCWDCNFKGPYNG